MRPRAGLHAALLVPLLLACGLADAAASGPARQTRPPRTAVNPSKIRVMDGDTMEIQWNAARRETVRVLGIDTPELFQEGRDRRRNPRGAEARGFARGAFLAARSVRLLRAGHLDRYRRTLGYFYLDGRNYSVLAIEAGLARETVSRYGDNGLPEQARAVQAAARRARVRRAG